MFCSWPGEGKIMQSGGGGGGPGHSWAQMALTSLVPYKAVNREDKLSRRYRDRDLAKFESSRRYRER